MSSEERLAPCLDVGNKRFQRKHDWNATEEKNQEREHNESPDVKAEESGVELLTGNNGAEIDEESQVDQQVDNVGHVRFFRFLREPSVVTEAYSGGETY